jgi:hypothetical protein
MTRDDNDRQRRFHALHTLQKRKTIHTGQAHINEQNARKKRMQFFKRCFSRSASLDIKTGQLQRLRIGKAHRRVIFDKENVKLGQHRLFLPFSARFCKGWLSPIEMQDENSPAIPRIFGPQSAAKITHDPF